MGLTEEQGRLCHTPPELLRRLLQLSTDSREGGLTSMATLPPGALQAFLNGLCQRQQGRTLDLTTAKLHTVGLSPLLRCRVPGELSLPACADSRGAALPPSSPCTGCRTATALPAAAEVFLSLLSQKPTTSTVCHKLLGGIGMCFAAGSQCSSLAESCQYS